MFSKKTTLVIYSSKSILLHNLSYLSESITPLGRNDIVSLSKSFFVLKIINNKYWGIFYTTRAEK